MPLTGEYLGMKVAIDDLDQENQGFYQHWRKHELHVQKCGACDLLRYPTTTACPFCSAGEYDWQAVSGKGTVYSYGEVHHAIAPQFKAHTPYLLLLVELDEQRDQPKPYDGLRFTGNLVTADGTLAPPEVVRSVGIGSRVRVVFSDIGSDIALPQWTLDETAEQPGAPWRYAQE